MNDDLKQLVENWGEDLLIMDGYDDCIIGVAERFGSGSHIVYDLGKVLHRLVDDGMSAEEEHEWYQYNMLGAYVGENTPSFVYIS